MTEEELALETQACMARRGDPIQVRHTWRWLSARFLDYNTDLRTVYVQREATPEEREARARRFNEDIRLDAQIRRSYALHDVRFL